MVTFTIVSVTLVDISTRLLVIQQLVSRATATLHVLGTEMVIRVELAVDAPPKHTELGSLCTNLCAVSVVFLTGIGGRSLAAVDFQSHTRKHFVR